MPPILTNVSETMSCTQYYQKILPKKIKNSKKMKESIPDSGSKQEKMKTKKLSSRIDRLITAKRRRRKVKKTNCMGTDDALVASHKGYSCQFCASRDTAHRFTVTDSSMYVALDCEFVGVGHRKLSALGRCSIVDWNGNILCDIHAKPAEPITDFRTRWSGIRPHHMKRAVPLEVAQDIIRKHLQGKIVVGHAIHNDFGVMQISHPKQRTVDTAKCVHLKREAKFEEQQPASLKRLTTALLGRSIQVREHSSVVDARATMDLFKYSIGQLHVSADFSDRRRRPSHKSPEASTASTHNSYMDDEFWPEDISP